MKTLNTKKLIGTLAIACASLFTSTSANAINCVTGWTRVVGVYEYAINGSTYGYIYTVPEHVLLPGYYWYTYTANQLALIQAKMAYQNHESVYLYGTTTATACPTNTTGSRYIGTLYQLLEY